jgi:hypothetical protein
MKEKKKMWGVWIYRRKIMAVVNWWLMFMCELLDFSDGDG